MAISFRMPSKLSFRRSEYNQGRSKKPRCVGDGFDTQEFVFEDDVADDEIGDEFVELHIRRNSKFPKNGDKGINLDATAKKDNVKRYSVKPGDTLQSISLKYGCPISELKRVNNFYSDQEFYGLGKIKIPVKEHSLLSEILPLSSSNNSSDESINQTASKTFHVSIGQMFLEDNSHEAKSFLDEMDRDIQRIVEKTQNNKSSPSDSTLNGQTNTCISTRHFQGVEVDQEKAYDGASWGISWCSLILVILILGVLAPTLYGIYIAVTLNSEHQNLSNSSTISNDHVKE